MKIQSVVNYIGKHIQQFVNKRDKAFAREQQSFTKRYSSPHIILKTIVTVTANGKSKQVVAIIDTGCTNTSIPTSIVKALDLIPCGTQKMNAVNKSYICNYYVCDILIEDQIQIDNAVLMGLPILLDENEKEVSTANEELVLGMDILSKCDFAITNRNNCTKFTLAYPSKRDLDFTKE